MAWKIQFIGTVADVAPAVAALPAPTTNADEASQFASVQQYLASKFATVPGATGVSVACSGFSNNTGVGIVVSAQVITIT